MKNKFLIAIFFSLVPMVTDAATVYFADVSSMITQASNLLKVLVGMAFALAILAFFFGIARFLWNVDQPEKREEGRSLMIYSVVAIFVMVSIWGLVAFLQKAFIPQYTTVQVGNGGSSQTPCQSINSVLGTNDPCVQGSSNVPANPWSGGTNLNDNAQTNTLTGTDNASVYSTQTYKSSTMTGTDNASVYSTKTYKASTKQQ